MKDKSQYSIAKGDILTDNDLSGFSPAALMSVLLEIDHDHPGTLPYMVRMAALAADGWHIKATSSDPERSLQVQSELVELLETVDRSLQKAANERLKRQAYLAEIAKGGKQV